MGDVLANLRFNPFSASFSVVAVALVVFTKPQSAKHRWPSLFVRLAFLFLGMLLAVELMTLEFEYGTAHTWSTVVSLATSVGVSAFSTKRAPIVRLGATTAMLWALPFLLLPLVADRLPSRFVEGYGFGGILWIPVFLLGSVTLMYLNEMERVKWGVGEPPPAAGH